MKLSRNHHNNNKININNNTYHNLTRTNHSFTNRSSTKTPSSTNSCNSTNSPFSTSWPPSTRTSGQRHILNCHRRSHSTRSGEASCSWRVMSYYLKYLWKCWSSCRYFVSCHEKYWPKRDRLFTSCCRYCQRRRTRWYITKRVKISTPTATISQFSSGRRLYARILRSLLGSCIR